MRKVLSPLGGWLGGKFRLANAIIATFPAHEVYCEPFCGAAHVFFRKARAKREILNDVNGEIINLFRIIRDRPEELAAKMSYVMASRQEFERFRDEEKPADEVERAFRFVYVLKLAFGGRLYRKPSFSYGMDKAPGPHLLTLVAANLGAKLPGGEFEACAGKFPLTERLAADLYGRFERVLLESRDWSRVIDDHDGEGTLFYCDPPYEGSRFHYPGEGIFEPEKDLPRLRDRLAAIKGEFALSLNDSENVRELFKNFHIRELDAIYTCGQSKGRRGARRKELLITSYAPPRLNLGAAREERGK